MGGDYRKKIDLILKENEKAKRNKKLALYLINEVDAKYFYKLADFSEDSDIILSAIKQDASIYASLSSKMQRKTNFAQEALKSLVREKVSFIEVEKFLTRFFPDEKIFTQMFAFYKEYLKTVEYIFRTDIERQLIDIRKSSPHIYKEIFQKKLLEEQGKNISITQEFSQYFLEQVSLL